MVEALVEQPYLTFPVERFLVEINSSISIRSMVAVRNKSAYS